MITAQEALQRTVEHREIFHDEMLQLMRQIMAGEVSPVMTAAILTGLRVKKETVGEITAAAMVMRELSTKVDIPHNPHFVDIVGTGGDGSHTFNISTASMFVAAAAGATVAKHGNRSASSKVGSADVLEALGINLTAPSEKVSAAVEAVGITFLFAPGWHPALKSVAPLRKTLNIRTIFNLLGPLVNPLRPTGQVIGVYDAQFLTPIAEALAVLGTSKAMIVHGRERLDEAGLGSIWLSRSLKVRLISSNP